MWARFFPVDPRGFGPAAVCVCLAFFVAACGGDGEDKKPTTPTSMKPPKQGWKAAVGDGGTLLETFDDAAWDLRTISDHDLYAVSCVDNQRGWAVGAQGFVGHTSDGWDWPSQESGVSVTLRAVSFALGEGGGEVGLAVGDDATLLATRDGGEHWLRHDLTSDGSAKGTLRGTAITEGAGLLVAVGDGGLVARSTDGGQHFTSFVLPAQTDLYDIALNASGNLALAVDSAGGIWASHDGAQSFVKEYQARAALEGVSLGASSVPLGSATGASLALLRSGEGTWSEVALDAPVALHATLVGPREDRVYFAGDSGALLETNDGGLSLLAVPANTASALRGIEDLEPR